MKTGIYDNLSQEDYHSSEGISRTQLNLFRELPYKFWNKYMSGKIVQPEPSESLMLGSLVHTLVLEPHLFEEQYFVYPKIDRRTRAGKDAFDEVMTRSNGKMLVDQVVMDEAKAMADSLLANEFTQKMLSHSRIENSVYWEDSETNILCKSRPDIWKDSVVVDIKTTSDLASHAFQREAMRYGYFLQAGMISSALEAHGKELELFSFICVEKKAPYYTCVFVLDQEAIEFGKRIMREALDSLKDCIDKDEWPAYEVQTLSAPAYCLV